MRDDLSSAAGAAALANGQATTPAIKIDKSVPIPPKSSGRPRKGDEARSAYHYPWHQLQPGDSFLWPCDDVMSGRVRAGSAVSSRARLAGERYEVRAVTENGVRVVRVWRVA